MLSVCNTNLLDSGAVIQSMPGKQQSSLLNEINGRLRVPNFEWLRSNDAASQSDKAWPKWPTAD